MNRARASVARGETGVHHVSIEVDGLDSLLEELSAAGVPVRDTTPRPGSHGSRISFLDPAATGGVRVTDLPMTPERVWRAMSAGASAPPATTTAG